MSQLGAIKRPLWWVFIKVLLLKLWPLLSCAAFTAISVADVYSRNPNSFLIICSSAAALVFYAIAAFQAWKQEYLQRVELEAKQNSKHADFVLTIGPCLRILDSLRQATVLTFPASLVNRGHPSTAFNWTAHVRLPSGEVEATFWWAGDRSYDIEYGAEILCITNESLLQVKAMQIIHPGDARTGRLLMTIPARFYPEIEDSQFTVVVSLCDYLGMRFSATYEKGEITPPSLIHHAEEKVITAVPLIVNPD